MSLPKLPEDPFLKKEVLKYEYPLQIQYVYDFGDHWAHEVKIEKTIDEYVRPML